MTAPENREDQKIRLLRLLYEGRDCNSFGISFFDLGPQLGLDNKLTESITRELQYENLLKFNTTSDLAITPHGIDKIETIDSDSPEVQKLQSNRIMVLLKYYDIRVDIMVLRRPKLQNN